MTVPQQQFCIVIEEEGEDYDVEESLVTWWSPSHVIGPFDTHDEAVTHERTLPSSPYTRTSVVPITKEQ